MRKICLTVIGLYLLLLQAYSQLLPKDSSVYQRKPLHFSEANLVSSYYSQNGNHSAITGGIGTEKVIDISNAIEVKLVSVDPKQVKSTLSLGLGVDHHTAASSAWVSVTGASKTGGTRIYPSLNWTVEDPLKGESGGLGIYYSSEFNYHSIGGELDYGKKNSRGGEYRLGVKAYYDRVKLIYPSELRPSTQVVVTSASGGGDGNSIPSDPRFTLTTPFSFTQIINKRMQAGFFSDLSFQSGNLGLPFHRVYFVDGTEKIEALPSERFKVPLGLRVHYYIGDGLILRSYYRFYFDDWGITSHTFNLETPIKITSFISVSPFYRYYIQTASNYFAPYKSHTEAQTYYTSNYALSAFSSQSFGSGLKVSPPHPMLHGYLAAFEIRYDHYKQTTGLVSNVITLELINR